MNNKNIWLGFAFAALCTTNAYALNETKPLTKGGEYLVVSNYPDNLHIIDIKKDELVKTCKIPGKFGPGTVVMSPDKQRAYVLGNGFSEVFGFNVDNCAIEFSAKFAQRNNEIAP